MVRFACRRLPRQSGRIEPARGRSKPLAEVDPENIPVNRLPPPVVIEEVVIEGKERKQHTGAQL